MFGGAAPVGSDNSASINVSVAKTQSINTTPIVNSLKSDKKMSLMVKMPIPTTSSESKFSGANPTELTPMGVRSLMTALKVYFLIFLSVKFSE